ncbi:MAG: aspartate aminotransferase family protein [Gammaproteobacteria bacterium]
MQEHLMTTYARLPVEFVRGEGCWLWDSNNNKYLDALSGIGVCGLGHAHPSVSDAVCKQAKTLVHTSNLYQIPLQRQLASELSRITDMENAFICNSGAEAVEAAIKLARLHGHNKGIHEPVIIVADNSFHGRTMATLSASGNRKVQAGFEPLVTGFIRVAYNDVKALENIVSNTSSVAAILIEPIQGEGGINVPSPAYLNAVRDICDDNDWLMMLDEIQTGMCRTGKWLAYQHNGITPDVITLAKGLANGLPIGACMANGPAASLFNPGNHGSTFGGNPLVCSAALATIESLENESLAENAAAQGQYLLKGISEATKNIPIVKEVRGSGLMIGIELNSRSTDLIQMALAQRLLISIQAEKVIRLLPPLILNREEADLIIEKITVLLTN